LRTGSENFSGHRLRQIKFFSFLSMIVFTMLVNSGCRAPLQPEGPTEIVMSVRNYDAFVDSTLSVLRRWDFPADRVNREMGIIVSEPATSGQWFEPWRIDAPGAYQKFESSIHTMRRVVTVNLAPVESASADAAPMTESAPAGEIERLSDEHAARSGNYRVQVRVDKLRFSGVERQVTTTSGAMAMYSERTPTVAGQRGVRSREEHWVLLGRDPLLEERLLKKIATAAERLPDVSTAADSEAAESQPAERLP
jgi:hypothetical protein